MWAAATVLFELLMSGYPAWAQQHGPLMFGPSMADLAGRSKLQDEEERTAFTVGHTTAAHELWVSLVPLTVLWHPIKGLLTDTYCLLVHVSC